MKLEILVCLSFVFMIVDKMVDNQCLVNKL